MNCSYVCIIAFLVCVCVCEINIIVFMENQRKGREERITKKDRKKKRAKCIISSLMFVSSVSSNRKR